MTRETTRLTLIAAAPATGGPGAALQPDGPGDVKILARLGKSAFAGADRARIVCSPARVAVDTATALGYDAPTIDETLRDRSQGAWGGRSLADLAENEPGPIARWLCDPDFAPPDGESVADLVARAQGWLAHLRSPEPVLAITHPALIRAFVMAGLACAPAAWFRLDIAHSTRTMLTRNGDLWRVALVNAPL